MEAFNGLLRERQEKQKKQAEERRERERERKRVERERQRQLAERRAALRPAPKKEDAGGEAAGAFAPEVVALTPEQQLENKRAVKMKQVVDCLRRNRTSGQDEK